MDSGSHKHFTKKKLGIHQRVEVRSVQDGFMGSWHPGTVIDCGKLKRYVRYENILDDDGINNLEYVVRVSDALDGKSCSSDSYKRGFIRPLPPLIEFDRRSLEFGLCVDVNYHGAWWEGVIFDHNNGMEERSVFFPDLDDEMNIGTQRLRITQDWDEVTEKWEQRGKWVFLELIEESKETSYVAVSAKNIWYVVRGKRDFNRIGEWTFNVKDLWRDMVLDVLDEYLSIILQEVYSVLNLQRSLSEFQNDKSKMHQDTFDSHLSHVPLNPSKEIQDPHTSPATSPPPPVEVVDEPKFAHEPKFCPQAVVEYYSHAFKKNWPDKRKCIQKAMKHLLAEGWTLQHHPTYKRKGIKYISPQKKIFHTLHAACKYSIKESVPERTDSGMQPLDDSVINEENVDQVQNCDLLHRVSQLLPEKPALHGIEGVAASGSTTNRKRKRLRNSKTSLPKRQRNGLPLRVLRSSKRVSTPSLSHQKPQNVMSWLIDRNVVLPRSKVYYREKSRNHSMAGGRITCGGIKCNCCQIVYSLVGFEKHASGSSTCRPAASIFLEDGRSLLDCQIQIMHDYRIRESKEKPCSGLFQGENDDICSLCHYGGELVLCDQCPSSFHKTCLHMEDIPDGDWFCPSCRCGICGQNKTNGDEDGHFHTCFQCERKYHVKCVKSRAVDESRRYQENWFCEKNCEKIYVGLNKLLGVPVTVGLGNLTWTLVKFINSESCDLGSANRDLLAESYCKLNVALSVMHECFKPLKEPSSSRDLTEDVIFSRWSELNRLNYQGFYTVLLERNEELISVATIRIFGDKVAEIPLVGTRLQYRRHGMCRILMNELERKLMQLGVERLVLPAMPSVLKTWTSSFGFAKMTNFQRSELLNYTFLDFQGTIMCQKLLMKSPSPESVCQ